MRNGSNDLEALKEWQAAAHELDFWRKEEARRREAVIQQHSGWRDPLAEGTETVTLGIGLDIKIGHSVDYKLDVDEPEALALRAKVSAIIGQPLAERLIVLKPSLTLGEYRKCPPKAARLVEKVLIRKPRTKSLKLA